MLAAASTGKGTGRTDVSAATNRCYRAAPGFPIILILRQKPADKMKEITIHTGKQGILGLYAKATVTPTISCK